MAPRSGRGWCYWNGGIGGWLNLAVCTCTVARGIGSDEIVGQLSPKVTGLFPLVSGRMRVSNAVAGDSPITTRIGTNFSALARSVIKCLKSQEAVAEYGI